MGRYTTHVRGCFIIIIAIICLIKA